MTKIEFERKFVLDLRRVDKIHATLQERECSRLVTHKIKQCYAGGDRFRATTTGTATVYLKENKTSIKLGTPYSANIEEEQTISEKDFQKEWTTSTKRLQKTRHEVLLAPSYQLSLMVDYFKSKKKVYAVVAEVEMILDVNSHILAFSELSPPPYLWPYLLVAVNNADQDSKAFKSVNMIDTPDSIANIEKAYSKLYDSKSL